MKKFGKKFFALFMALMCIATIGAISASAAGSYYKSFDNSRLFSGANYYQPNSQYSFHAHYYFKNPPKGYKSEVRNRWARPNDKVDHYADYGVKSNGHKVLLRSGTLEQLG